MLTIGTRMRSVPNGVELLQLAKRILAWLKSIGYINRPQNMYFISISFYHIIKVPSVHEFVSPIIAIVPLQLLAYYIAEYLGKDVDQPRNLAKSVTVE